MRRGKEEGVEGEGEGESGRGEMGGEVWSRIDSRELIPQMVVMGMFLVVFKATVARMLKWPHKSQIEIAIAPFYSFSPQIITPARLQ